MFPWADDNVYILYIVVALTFSSAAIFLVHISFYLIREITKSLLRNKWTRKLVLKLLPVCLLKLLFPVPKKPPPSEPKNQEEKVPIKETLDPDDFFSTNYRQTKKHRVAPAQINENNGNGGISVDEETKNNSGGEPTLEESPDNKTKCLDQSDSSFLHEEDKEKPKIQEEDPFKQDELK